MQCRRTFWGRDARKSEHGVQDACAFSDCDGSGYGLDLLDLDDPFTVGLARDPEALCAPRERARRDALLGIITTDDPRDLAQFTDVDLVRLAALLQERYVDPDDRTATTTPRVIDLLVFMARWPEARLHGRATGGVGARARCVLDGIYCDLDHVDPSRRALLRKAFDFFSDADVCELDGEFIYAWWF
jgi:hypothetical protein